MTFDSDPSHPICYRFDHFRLETRSGKLIHDQNDLAIAPMIYQLLLYFLQRPGELVSREAIHAAVWENKVIEFDQNLNFSIRRLRQLLGDDSREPRFIETVPKRGYRFIMPVSIEPVDGVQGHSGSDDSVSAVDAWQPAVSQSPSRGAGRRFTTVVLISGLLFATVLMLSLKFGQHQLPRVAVSEQSGPELDIGARQADYLLAREDASEAQLSEAVRLLNRAIDETPGSQPQRRSELEGALMEATYRLSYHQPQWRDTLQSLRDRLESSAHSSMRAQRTDALAALHLDFDLQRAESSMRQALALDADDRTARHYMPLILAMRGKAAESLAFVEASLVIDPGYTQVQAHAGWFHLINQRFEKAIELCQASLRLDPNWLMGHQCLSQAMVGRDDLAGSRAAYQAYLSMFDLTLSSAGASSREISRLANRQLHDWLMREQPSNAFQLARTAALSGDNDIVQAQLQNLIDQRSAWLPYLTIFPEFRPHDDWINRHVRPLITF